MPFLQSSGAISINDIKTLFGGPASPSLSNYYRGSGYIPSSKTVSTTTRDPASGEYYNRGSYAYNLTQGWGRADYGSNSNTLYLSFSNGTSQTAFTNVPGNITSYAIGGSTYFRGTYRAQTYFNDGYSAPYTLFWYGYWKETYSNTYPAINTNVPTSGTGPISLNQFYGAEKP